VVSSRLPRPSIEFLTVQNLEWSSCPPLSPMTHVMSLLNEWPARGYCSSHHGPSACTRKAMARSRQVLRVSSRLAEKRPLPQPAADRLYNRYQCQFDTLVVEHLFAPQLGGIPLASWRLQCQTRRSLGVDHEFAKKPTARQFAAGCRGARSRLGAAAGRGGRLAASVYAKLFYVPVRAARVTWPCSRSRWISSGGRSSGGPYPEPPASSIVRT
jgi:hypothetical protein